MERVTSSSVSATTTPLPAVTPETLVRQNEQLLARVDALEQQVKSLLSVFVASTNATAAAAPTGEYQTRTLTFTPTPSLHFVLRRQTVVSIGHGLHKDALHSIFACLLVHDLSMAHQTCRAWHATVSSLPDRGFHRHVRSRAQFNHLLQGLDGPLLAFHIRTLILHPCFDLWPHELAAVSDKLKNLQHLYDKIMKH